MPTPQIHVSLSTLQALLADAAEERILNSEQAAARLGVKPYELRAWARDGLVPCQFVGGQYLFSAEALIDWLANTQRRTPPATAPAKPAPPAPPPRPATEEERAEGARFVEAFGKDGAVWFCEGRSFAEAKRLFDQKYGEQLAKLRLTVGPQLARFTLANRLKREQGLSGDQLKLANINKGLKAKFAEMGGGGPDPRSAKRRRAPR